MIHVLIDSTVPLNIFLHGIKGMKRPMPMESARVMAASLTGAIAGYATPTAYSNAYYFLQKFLPLHEAKARALDMLDAINIIGQDEAVFRNALASGWADVEDAGQYEAARRMLPITHICTNNLADYARAKGMKVLDPAQLLQQLK